MKEIKILALLAILAACLAACSPPPTAAAESPRILYFTTRTDSQESLLAPGNLRAALGAQAVGEWGDLMVLHSAQPAGAILIDGASVDEVNADDLTALYRQCVVLAFFNLYAPEVSQLVNDPSVRSGGWMDGSEPYPSDFYIVVHRVARTADQACAADVPSSELSGLGKGFSQYSLASEEDFEVFVGVLTTHLTHPQP